MADSPRVIVIWEGKGYLRAIPFLWKILANRDEWKMSQHELNDFDDKNNTCIQFFVSLKNAMACEMMQLFSIFVPEI